MSPIQLPPDDQPPPRRRPPWCTGPADDRHTFGLDQLVGQDTVIALMFHDDGCLSFRVRSDVEAAMLSEVIGHLAMQLAAAGDFRLADGHLTVTRREE